MRQLHIDMSRERIERQQLVPQLDRHREGMPVSERPAPKTTQRLPAPISLRPADTAERQNGASLREADIGVRGAPQDRILAERPEAAAVAPASL